MTNLTSYGVHFDEDRVGWLVQGRGSANAVGLRATVNYQVRLPSGKRHCNHQIALATPVPNDRHWDMFMRLQDDPLVRAMMPFPKTDGGVYFLEEGDRLVDFLVMLSRMTSPILPIVVPFYTFDGPADILKELGDSNIQPLVLYGAKLSDAPLIREISQAATHRARRLIMTGSSEIVTPTVVRKISTELTSPNYDFNELNALPWESLGSTAVKKWMRREWHIEQSLKR